MKLDQGVRRVRKRPSPPVWGAWVEIISETALPPLYDPVAPRVGGVG